MQRVLAISSVVLLWLCNLGATATDGDEKYREEIESWRQKRLADLKAPDGWLSVTGLYWLRPGETRLGSDPASDLLLPDRLPGSFGTLNLSDGKVEFRPPPGSPSPGTASHSRAGRSIRMPTSNPIPWRSWT